jgi:putative DNA primase/helicase
MKNGKSGRLSNSNRPNARARLAGSGRRPDHPRESRIVGTKLATIRRMLKEGFSILPVVEGGKMPAIKGGHNSASKDSKVVESWFDARPRRNFGVRTGAPSKIFVVDVDGAKGKAALKALVAAHGALPKTWRVRTPHGEHRYFRKPDYSMPCSVGTVAEGIDIRADGGYVVGPGSETPNGTYQFVAERGPGEVEIAEVPRWLLRLVRRSRSPKKNAPTPAPKLSPEQRARAVRYAQAAFRSELERLRKAPNHQRNATLNICGFKLGRYVVHRLLDRSTVERELAKTAKRIGLDDGEIFPTINSGLRAGMKYPARLPFQRASSASIDVKPPTTSNERLATELSLLAENDIANAERFVRRFGQKVLFSEHNGWMIFDGKRYLSGAALQCMGLAKQVVSKISEELRFIADEGSRTRRAKFAEASKSLGSIERMLSLAKHQLLVVDRNLDADPWLLSTETCTIDLRTGRHHDHDPRDLLTKIARIAARRDAECPLFTRFLHRITEGDEGLKTYIQKAVGYSITGIANEQVLFFVFGKSGSNGKSTLVNLIRDMLGDYGCHTPTETLLTKQYDNAIPADLARLEGARMVTAIESNVNRQLDEAKIKAMTGGEPITARHLYKNYFEFLPQFKLWFVANDRPRVRATDDGIWRRIRVIPLNAKIPPNEVDPDLPRKLRAEWPGILNWAIRGALKWRRDGLLEPATVKQASAGWREAVDHVRAFVTETLILDSGLESFVPAGDLHGRYKQWCTRYGEMPMSAASLKSKLKVAFDLMHKRTKRGSEWHGVRWKN